MITPIRQACILVGGKGTRLGDVARSTPKPLLEIGQGICFLDFLIEWIARHGFDDLVLLAGHLGHLVQRRYHGRTFCDARVRVRIEPQPQGTAGALVSARDMLQSRFLLLNGDSFFDIDVRALATEAGTDGEAMIALRRVPEASRFGAVQLNGDRILSFHEKVQAGPALISAGIYVLNASIVDLIYSLPCSIETDIFPVLAADGLLKGRICDGYFIDIGLPETLQQSQRELLALRPWGRGLLDRMN